jgi:NAD-dependent deacetylase
MEDSELDRAAELLQSARSIAALTGAGVSAESGVPTFRGAGGLWKNFRPEEVATPQAFQRDPVLVWEFYNERRNLLTQVQPNAAHRALVELERRPARFTLITQNVDGLHQAAGSRRVLEIHGTIRAVRCTACGRVWERPSEQLAASPRCEGCGGLLRPNVVWFGESLPVDVWQAAERAASECDCMLVIGTSAQVHPAASLAWIARDAGANVIEINVEASAAREVATCGLYGKAGEILPQLMARLDRSAGEGIGTK